MAQSVGEARKVWLAIEQSLDHPDNAFAISQAAVSSSVCHVDFRAQRVWLCVRRTKSIEGEYLLL